MLCCTHTDTQYGAAVAMLANAYPSHLPSCAPCVPCSRAPAAYMRCLCAPCPYVGDLVTACSTWGICLNDTHIHTRTVLHLPCLTNMHQCHLFWPACVPCSRAPAAYMHGVCMPCVCAGDLVTLYSTWGMTHVTHTHIHTRTVLPSPCLTNMH